MPEGVSAKDVILNMLTIYGANTLLGYSIELYGDAIDRMSLDDRITIASMATEMGAIIILFPPSADVIKYCRQRTKANFKPVYADSDASYEITADIDVSNLLQWCRGRVNPTIPFGVKGAASH